MLLLLIFSMFHLHLLMPTVLDPGDTEARLSYSRVVAQVSPCIAITTRNVSSKCGRSVLWSGSLKSNLGVGKSLKLVIPVYLFVGEDVTSKPPPIPINITKPKQGPPTPPKPNTYQGLLVSPLRMVNVAKSPLHVSTSPKSSSCVMPVAMSTHQSFEKGRKGMKMLFVYV
ncbi:hypothetical protein GQR58_015312 [Nymphon striatum]|nr:hypothetical protein GQR58_015312 [Nymphon striatum]